MRGWSTGAYGWLAGGRIGTLYAIVPVGLSVSDSFGQRANLVDADGTVNGRLTFSYDGNGNQLTAQNSVGTYTMAYDAGNEVTSVQGLWGTVLTFTYDAGGNRSVTQDNFGGVTSYTHDANGNLTQEEFGGTNQTAMRIDLGYDKNNQLTSETRYSDLAGNTKVATTSMAYDGDGNRLNQVDLNGSGGNIANYTWTYDAADRLTTEKLNGGATVSYTYDNANELTGDGVTSPTYDATGNRSGAGYTVSTGNELTVDPNDTYSYDAAGEETKAVIKSSGNAWVYTYDPKGEVTKAQLLQYDPAIHGTGDPVLQEVDYKYDALGNMVERDYPTGTGSPVTRYAQDGWDPALAGATGTSNFNVWAELDGNNSNALLTRYFHGDQVDQLFGRQDAKVAYWTLTDRLGSVRDVLDNSGNVKDALSYDGWGNILSGETGPSYRGNYAWTGRMFDVETDLQYNRARWYDPTTGRWQTQDPLGFSAGDSNLFRYVENKATFLTDPSGDYFMVFFPPTKGVQATLDDGKYGYKFYSGVELLKQNGDKWPARGRAIQRVISSATGVYCDAGKLKVATSNLYIFDNVDINEKIGLAYGRFLLDEHQRSALPGMRDYILILVSVQIKGGSMSNNDYVRMRNTMPRPQQGQSMVTSTDKNDYNNWAKFINSKFTEWSGGYQYLFTDAKAAMKANANGQAILDALNNKKMAKQIAAYMKVAGMALGTDTAEVLDLSSFLTFPSSGKIQSPQILYGPPN